jgi:hypothetical protein
MLRWERWVICFEAGTFEMTEESAAQLQTGEIATLELV